MAEHDTLAQALVASLADLTVVDKGRTVDFTTDSGKRVHYDYADLPSTISMTRPVLAEHGIAALTPVHAHGDGLACTVILIHTSGERLDFDPFPFPHGRDAQATGSMVTYHRRYALTAALGIAAGDDDDGATAQPREATTSTQYVPGFKSSVIDTINGLNPAEAKLVRAWCKENRIPIAPADMNQEQAGRVTEYIVQGLPMVDPEEAS